MSTDATRHRWLGRTSNRLIQAPLLPGRPPAGASWAGPVASADDPTRPARTVRAICCSGGGIRAAAFSLGGLQFLNQQREANGSSYYANTDLITSVSGGGFTAGSYAFVQHCLEPATSDPAAEASGDAELPVYAPGSPEDNRLRAHTRYLADSKTQLAISILGIAYGLVLNLLAILAAAYVLATGLGFAVGAHGLDVLTRHGNDWTAYFSAPLKTVLFLVAVAGVAVYSVYRFVDLYIPLSDSLAKLWSVLALTILGLAGSGALLLLGVPWLLEQLNGIRTVHNIPGSGQAASITGTAAAVLAIVQRLIRTYQPGEGAPASELQVTAKKKALPLLTRLGNALLPWVGSALVVVMIVIAMLTWVWNAAVLDPTHWRSIWPALLGLGYIVAWKALTDVNRTSLHRYYSQRIAAAFGVARADGLTPTADTRKLSSYRTSTDKPALVICAAVNTDQPGATPSGRNCAPFTFSAHYSGLSSGTMFTGDDADGYDLASHESGGTDRQRWWQHRVDTQKQPGIGLNMPTAELETRGNALTLSDLVAVSGAAVSPAMGRMSRPSMRLLFGVANVRLGMWLPNPLHKPIFAEAKSGVVRRIVRQQRQPGLFYLAQEMFGGLTLRNRWVYVTDGGHYENLGLVEALRRGATEVVVFDASGDTPFSLSTFGEAVETARADLGVEINWDSPVPLGRITPENPQAKALAATATATYANGVRARIVICKAAMVAELPPDLASWAAAHPQFPNDSTLDQFYGDREFEAYRRLGCEAAAQAYRLLNPPAAVPAKPLARKGNAGMPRRNLVSRVRVF